jgi:hypothetical protein
MVHISVKTQDNEQFGIYVEKIICDIANIPFNTKRDKNMLVLPQEQELVIKNDIQRTLKDIPLKFKEHIGGRNGKTDYILESDNTASVKSTSSTQSKICPQVIGQTSPNKLGEYFSTNINSNDDFKKFIGSNSLRDVLSNHYLPHTFICDITLIYLFNKSKMYIIKKHPGAVMGFVDGEIRFAKSHDLWNETISVHLVREGKKYPIGEFQTHSKRNSCKFRFNINNLVENNLLTGLDVSTYHLENKYSIKVDKTHFMVDANVNDETPNKRQNTTL